MATSTLDLNVKPATAAEIIKLTNNYLESLGIQVSALSRTAYHHFIRTYLNEYRLDEKELKKLARELHIEWFDRDISIPQSFIPSISIEYKGIKYTNPDDHQDFTIFCSSESIFGVKCVLKHTQKGYQDPSFFTHFVPSLAIVKSNYEEALKPLKVEKLLPKKRDDILRRLGQQHINSPLNQEYKQNGMHLTELQIIHLFFNLYMPGIQGICQQCFKLSLPLNGFGARWHCKNKSQDGIRIDDIRLSVPKINSSYDAHKVLYVTHSVESPQNTLHVAFEGVYYVQRTNWNNEKIESQLSLSQPLRAQLFSKQTHLQPDREPAVHIPYDLYNNYYLDVIQNLPNITNQDFLICQCQK